MHVKLHEHPAVPSSKMFFVNGTVTRKIDSKILRWNIFQTNIVYYHATNMCWEAIEGLLHKRQNEYFVLFFLLIRIKIKIITAKQQILFISSERSTTISGVVSDEGAKKQTLYLYGSIFYC